MIINIFWSLWLHVSKHLYMMSIWEINNDPYLQTFFKMISLYITPSYYHHCANFIWRHWTYKMPVRYNLSNVWVRLSIFSQLSIIQYVGLCVFSLPISFVMIGRIYIFCLIIIIKSEVWTITHCLGLGHETMLCAVCLSIFLFVYIQLFFYISRISCIQLKMHSCICSWYDA